MSNLASTSRVQMRYIKESTFGVIPVAGNPNNLRMTGETIDLQLSKASSAEIRADRQIGGATTIDASVPGDINFHMQYGEYDTFLQAVLMSNYAIYGTNGVGSSFSAAYTATTITAAVAPSGNSDFTANLQQGQWFQVVHAANANNGKFFRVSTIVAPTTTVITLDASTPATAATSSSGCTLGTSRCSNGIVESSYTLEENATDVGQFLTYTGMYTSKMSLKFASAALLSGAFSFLGKTALRNVATQLPGTPTASKTFDIQNAVRGVGQIWENGVPLAGTYLKTFDLMIDNNLRGQTAVGNLGPVGIGIGDCMISGTFTAYFATGALYDKFLADTYTSLTIGCQDNAGNGYIFTLPRVMLMTGKITSGAKNTDMMTDFTFTAFADDANANPALRKTLFLDRVGVSVS